MSRFFDRRLLQEAQQQRGGLALTIALSALGGAATVGQAFALSQAVAGVFLGGRDLAGVWPWLGGLIACTVLRAGAAWLAEIAAGRVAVHVKTALRARLLHRILALGPAYTQGERAGELVNTATEGVEALDAYFSQYLPQVALAALIPALFLAFIFPADPLTGLALLLTAPLIPLFMMLIGSLADALTRRQWVALTRMSAHFLDVLQGLTTLKLFGRSREQIAVIRQITDRHRDATLAALRVAFLSALVLEMVGTLGTAIVAVEIGLRLLYGKMAFQQAFFVLILAPEFYLPLRLLGTRFHAGMAGVAAARRIFEVLETEGPGERDRRRRDGLLSETQRRLRNEVEGGAAPTSAPPPLVRLEDVSYAYPGRTLPALERVALEIRPGEKVALIGPTGAGKSTIAALLLGFIAPTAGAVNFVATGAEAAQRPAIAWVPQAPHLFDASVADNIRLGRPDAPQAEVERAAAAASADAFIRGLPQGYATRIGERGSRLSAGQAQRLALARAFLLDAPLVILDEPTAHLDAAAEAEVQAASERLMQGRSALIIAHRLHTVRRADRVIVLEHGRVVASGPADVVLAGRDPEDLAVEPAIEVVEGLAQEARPAATVGWAPPGRPPMRAPAIFRRLLAFLAPSWRWVALSVILGFLTVASSIGLLATSAWIIAAAALQPSVAVLQVAIVGVRFFGISRGLLRYGERLASHQVTFRVLAEIRVWFYAAIEPLAPARLADRHSGDLLSRIVADIGALEHFFIRAVAPPLVALLTAGLIAAFLGAYHPALATPALLGLAFTGLAAPGLTWALARRPGRRLADQRARLNALLVDGIQGAADLIALRADGRATAAVRNASVALGRTQIQLAALAGLSNALGILGAWLTMAATLATAIPLATAGRLAGVNLAALALATGAGFEAVLPLPLAAQYLANSLAAGRRLFELAAVEQPSRPEQTSPGLFRPPAPAEPAAAARPPAIRFRSVTLRYAPDRPPALDDVTFDAPAGRIVAIVGPSGAGKTSLANALLRFWDYEAGEIYLDGREIRTLDAEAVRAQIGVAAHDPHLFNLTVAENLRLARPTASQAEIEAAARAAGVHDFIASLPEGYDTWLGEGGARLSGGERQKLALARALVKDAPILLLDEPTAHLDADAERQAAETLARLAPGRTILLITHRRPLARIADQVIVMERGRIAARHWR